MAYQKKGPAVIDITKEAQALEKKDFIEVKFKLKGAEEEQRIKGQSLTQIHGALARICKDNGLNYTHAFEYHEVVQ